MKTCPAYPGLLDPNSDLEGVKIRYTLPVPYHEPAQEGILLGVKRWDGKVVEPVQYRYLTCGMIWENKIENIQVVLNNIGRQRVMQYIAQRLTGLPKEVIQAGASWSWDIQEAFPESGMWLLEGQNWFIYLHPGMTMGLPDMPEPKGQPEDYIDEVLCKAAEFASQQPIPKQ